jgi:hypothetical protein
LEWRNQNQDEMLFMKGIIIDGIFQVLNKWGPLIGKFILSEADQVDALHIIQVCLFLNFF